MKTFKPTRTSRAKGVKPTKGKFKFQGKGYGFNEFHNPHNNRKEKFKNTHHSGIRVNKDDVWAQTDAAKLKLLRRVFKAYVSVNLAYDYEDTNILLEIFDSYISERTITNYFTRTSREIYLGIINENLTKLKNYI